MQNIKPLLNCKLFNKIENIVKIEIDVMLNVKYTPARGNYIKKNLRK